MAFNERKLRSKSKSNNVVGNFLGSGNDQNGFVKSHINAVQGKKFIS